MPRHQQQLHFWSTGPKSTASPCKAIAFHAERRLDWCSAAHATSSPTPVRDRGEHCVNGEATVITLLECCAFSKHYAPENYVIGAISDSLKLMAGWSFDGFLQSGRGSGSALTSCWNLLSCAISSRCCSEQAHGVHASARASGCSGCSYRAGGQMATDARETHQECRGADCGRRRPPYAEPKSCCTLMRPHLQR
jgi:hypothetical protein